MEFSTGAELGNDIKVRTLSQRIIKYCKCLHLEIHIVPQSYFPAMVETLTFQRTPLVETISMWFFLWGDSFCC